MKWCEGGGGSRSWFSNEAMSIDSDARGGFIDVPLAQTGEGIAECELLKWFVKEVCLFILTKKIQSFSILHFNSAILMFAFREILWKSFSHSVKFRAIKQPLR